jgi:hypothetical protein
MNYFLIGLGIAAAFLAFAAHDRLNKLEKHLKQQGLLKEGWDKDKNV